MTNYAHEQTESVSAAHAMTELDRATDTPDLADDTHLSGIPHDNFVRDESLTATLVALQAGQRAAALLTRRPDLARIPCVGVVLNEGTAGAA